MAEFTYQLYGRQDAPSVLLIYLHGFNHNQENNDRLMSQMAPLIPNALIVAPLSDVLCENNPQTRQWYSIDAFDPQNRRRNPQSSVDEIMDIYDTAGEQLAAAALRMNHFISEMQQKYQIDDGHTYLAGFSQGAQLALYTALTRKSVIGGCIMFSGIVAGKNLLEKEMVSHPQILLMHGDKDEKILSKTHEASRHWLLRHGLHLKSIYMPELDHKVVEAELQEAAKMLNLHTR